MPSLVDFLLLSAIWGASFLFMQLALGDFGALPTAALRVAIAAAFLLPLVAWRRQLPVLRRHWRPVLFVGLLNSGIPFALYCFALQSLSTGLSAILNAATPLFGALVAWVWLKDRPDGSRVIGLAVGFLGVAWLASGKASLQPVAGAIPPLWAVLACLGACLCYGLSASFAKRYLGGIPPLVTAAGSQVGGTLALAPLALGALPATMPGPTAWAAVVVVGVLCTGVAYILFFRLIEQGGPARALAVPFVVPVFAVVYGTVFLDERITPLMVACGAVIIAGTALATGLLRLRRLV
jgi:drug/metabolite transporter (DMT)-like permease